MLPSLSIIAALISVFAVVPSLAGSAAVSAADIIEILDLNALRLSSGAAPLRIPQ